MTQAIKCGKVASLRHMLRLTQAKYFGEVDSSYAVW